MATGKSVLAFLCLLLATIISGELLISEPLSVQASSDTSVERTTLAAVAQRIQALRSERTQIQQLLDAQQPRKRQERLGQALFFDKIISGNRNISCATCHHPMAALGDGLSLPVGEGGTGLGITRNTGEAADSIHARVPRNAPHLFNLGLTGAGYFPDLFWDGRVAVNPKLDNGFVNPQGENLPKGFISALAVQAVFPITSNDEMAGGGDENRQGALAASGRIAGPEGVWELVTERLRQNPEYVEMFKEAFQDIATAEDITIVHVGNAIAAFESVLGESLNSPFDRYLLGERSAMSQNAKRGMRLFYGKAQCYQCHSGALQTDNQFHAIAMPQIGPGKGDGYDGLEDFGRERVTGDGDDRYRFRTPSLRNIALTAPYGHSGAYDTLEDVVDHHLNAEESLRKYNAVKNAVLPYRKDLEEIDFVVHRTRRNAIAAANELPPVELTAEERLALLDFLHALTDFRAIDLRRWVPETVPSGLPVLD